MSANSIVERVTAAITDHRLPPGTKLGEEYLCGIFAVSRTIVRQALVRLADEKLVTLERGRGASVVEPSEVEARDVFEARRVVECAIVSKVARIATAADIARLRAQSRREHAAVAAGTLYTGTAKGTQFLSQFHDLIADIAGNQVLAELLHALASRTSVIERFFETSMTPVCSAEEHVALLASIERHDPEAASRLMAEHLAHIESCLRLPDSAPSAVDIQSVLSECNEPQF
jgi:DNA-binding GntR family transcriptional regulator